MENIIKTHILECFRYQSVIRTIKQLNKYINAPFEELKEELSNYDFNSVWCNKFWEKYLNQIINTLKDNDNSMLFNDLLLKINFTNDINPAVYTTNIPDKIQFNKDIAGIWIFYLE